MQWWVIAWSYKAESRLSCWRPVLPFWKFHNPHRLLTRTSRRLTVNRRHSSLVRLWKCFVIPRKVEGVRYWSNRKRKGYRPDDLPIKKNFPVFLGSGRYALPLQGVHDHRQFVNSTGSLSLSSPSYLFLINNFFLVFINKQVQKYRVDAYGQNTRQVHSNCRPDKHSAGAD